MILHSKDFTYKTRKEIIEIYTILDKESKKLLKIAEKMLKEAEEAEGAEKDKNNQRIGALDFHIRYYFKC